PDRSLMVGAVPLADATLITGRVAWLARSEGAQPDGSEEALLHRRDDAACLVAGEQRHGQPSDRIDLVRAQGGLDGPGEMIHVHYVVQAAARLVPEAPGERFPSAPERLPPALREAASGGQGIQPQRLDLHRLAGARRHDPV